MDVFMSTVILMGIMIIHGIIMIITKKVPFNGTDKYTAESLRAYAVPRGVLSILISLLVIGFSYSLRETKFSMTTLVVFIAFVATIIVYFVVKKKMLVRK